MKLRLQFYNHSCLHLFGSIFILPLCSSESFFSVSSLRASPFPLDFSLGPSQLREGIIFGSLHTIHIKGDAAAKQSEGNALNQFERSNKKKGGLIDRNLELNISIQ